MQAAKPAIQHQTTMRRVIDELYNRGTFTHADEFYAAHSIRHDPATTDAKQGPEGAKQIAARYRTAFPDLHIKIEEMMSEGEFVVTRWSSTGTHLGDLQGIAPTGKKISITGISIARFAHNKIAEEWVNWDTLGMMTQLGLIAT